MPQKIGKMIIKGEFMKKQFIDFELDGIDTMDYPDFCDAFICNASVIENNQVRPATQNELDELNNDSDLVYNLVINQVF